MHISSLRFVLIWWTTAWNNIHNPQIPTTPSKFQKHSTTTDSPGSIYLALATNGKLRAYVSLFWSAVFAKQYQATCSNTSSSGSGNYSSINSTYSSPDGTWRLTWQIYTDTSGQSAWFSCFPGAVLPLILWTQKSISRLLARQPGG